MSEMSAEEFVRQLESAVDSRLPPTREKLELLDRVARWGLELAEGLEVCYSLTELFKPILDTVSNLHLERSARLHQRDRERILRPDWFQKPDLIGYACYTEQFAGSLSGVKSRIPYLNDLGVSYLHLMPLLEPRPGENDGGYAVKNYRAIRADLGSMDDLEELAMELHASGISLTLDLVLNHVAKEHEWALRAKAGEEKYRGYFYIFDDQTLPNEFEKTLPEVFPDFAPGNFTFDADLNAWVWTTFNEYQWDVNWSNPDVFVEFASIIGYLANRGVDCLRLDAIAFIWKRLGTNCQGQPEVHAITQALRALARIVTPSLIFKAEAIVGPAEVGAYLGEGSRAGKLSDLAYHNSLMVQIWSSVAAKDSRLFETAMSRFKALPANTAWATYLRCHDDIGWAIDDSDAWQVGLNGHQHRMFLADFFTGKFFGSKALGQDFQIDPVSGERRTSGTTSALTGLESAVTYGQTDDLDQAIARYLCAYAMVFGFGGIPLLYMGDEIALPNDYGFVNDLAKRQDNRWLHRPMMDWVLVEKVIAGGNSDLQTKTSSLINQGMRNLISVRKRLASIHAVSPTKVRSGSGQGVVIFERNHPAGVLLQVYNLSESARWVNKFELEGLEGQIRDELTQTQFEVGDGFMIDPYQHFWLTRA